MNHWTAMRRGKAAAGDILAAAQVVQPPVPVRFLATQMGVELWEADGPSGWAGYVESNLTGWARIIVNRNDAPVRQRFTIAHELGHLMLHPLGTRFRDTSFSGGTAEMEANAFAADLLMPARLVEIFYPDEVENLAWRFQVSAQAMRFRLQNLGLPVDQQRYG